LITSRALAWINPVLHPKTPMQTLGTAAAAADIIGGPMAVLGALGENTAADASGAVIATALTGYVAYRGVSAFQRHRAERNAPPPGDQPTPPGDP
jgi:hypothetical protein